MENLEALRSEILAIHTRRSNRRYSPALQARIVACYHEQRSEKRSLRFIAKALDIDAKTLRRYVDGRREATESQAIALRPVRVIEAGSSQAPAEAPPPAIVLRVGSRISVSGLGVDEVLLVLRGLQ